MGQLHKSHAFDQVRLFGCGTGGDVGHFIFLLKGEEFIRGLKINHTSSLSQLVVVTCSWVVVGLTGFSHKSAWPDPAKTHDQLQLLADF